jgi:hypothetical protein
MPALSSHVQLTWHAACTESSRRSRSTAHQQGRLPASWASRSHCRPSLRCQNCGAPPAPSAYRTWRKETASGVHQQQKSVNVHWRARIACYPNRDRLPPSCAAHNSIPPRRCASIPPCWPPDPTPGASTVHSCKGSPVETSKKTSATISHSQGSPVIAIQRGIEVDSCVEPGDDGGTVHQGKLAALTERAHVSIFCLRQLAWLPASQGRTVPV